MTSRTSLLLVAASAAALACAPDLRVDHPFDGVGSVDGGPLVSAQTLDGGVTEVKLNASSKTAWTYLDLDHGREMKLDEALASNGWELKFRRVEVSSNGGSTNPAGQVSVAVVNGTSFAALTRAPASGFLQDGLVSVFNPANDEWYNYDLFGHGVTPRVGRLYVVKSSDAAYFKLEFLGYYDTAGTSGVFTLQYAPVDPP
jgi:hypothetical protein